MDYYVREEQAEAVLELLRRIDDGYEPTRKELRDLREIHIADFSDMQLTSLPESIGNLTQLTGLRLSNNQLTSLPESIGNITQLTELNMSYNPLTSLPESIGNLTQLTGLRLSNNQLTSLPEGIGNLTQLTGLRLSNNQLTSLPENIGSLSQLDKLDLSNNQLTSLPESIGNLTQLAELDLSDNQLISLPESISNLSKLNKLDLTGNQLTSLPESIGDLSQLTDLRLSGNQLTSLPESTGNLSKLLRLYIIRNQFKEVPDFLNNLKCLTTLHLSGNPISTLPSWLGDMQQLTSLGLWNLNLNEVPCWIRQLSNLEELYLDMNPMKILPSWLGDMPKLKSLSIRDMQLTEIPQSLLNLKLPFFADINAYMRNHFTGITIEGTELSIQPISLFDQSRDQSPDFQESRKLIEDYFNAPKIPIREGKVIFLGDGKVGKTFTIQRLLHDCRKDEYPTKETHGILIENLHTKKDGQDYTVRVWDFGGQDIMHEMHRCFLTDRTCYVVMVDTRTDKQTGRARYWLRTVQSVAPKAPVLLLVNEISGGQNRDLDYNALKRDFPNLVGVKYCSSLDASETEFRQKVEDSIFEQALNLDSCKMDLPESWELVRQSLLEQKEDKTYYIDREKFHNLCDLHGVPSDDGLRAWLLTWFNDLGVCFSYHLGENGQEQSTDYKILDPMWLTSAVYKIIWEKARTDDGLISLSEIYRILEKPGSEAMRQDGIPCLEDVSYNQAECGYVLEIMRMFRISYPANENTEFMPTLCKPDSNLDPTPKIWKQHAAYQFRYKFLPESVLHRLMIYCFANLRPGKRWRKGFWLECEALGLSAVIRTEGKGSEENILQIDVYAQQEQYEAWTWLQPLCQQIIKINDMLSLKSTAYVLAENDKEKEWFELDSVLHWKREGAPNMQGKRSLFPIQSLLILIYGRHYPDVERKLMEEQENHQLLIPSKVMPNTITDKITADYTELDLGRSFKEQFPDEWQRFYEMQEQLNKLLQEIRDGYVILPQDIIIELAKEFRRSEYPVLRDAGEKMSEGSSENKTQTIRNLLGDTANMATIAQLVIQLGTTLGPALLDLLK